MGCAEDTVEGLRARTELGGVGFADEYGASGTHALVHLALGVGEFAGFGF